MTNFIRQDFLQDLSICDELIDYYNSNEKRPGKTYSGITPSEKISTDVSISNENDLRVKRYLLELNDILKKYIEEYKYCNEYSAFRVTDLINIQYYKPNEGYFSWHCERASSLEPFASRHLVFMTYLNDVDDAGETEFYYQKLKVKPKKGLTLIWPADWTHTHRGVTSPTQEKYIITGWLNFANKV
jgi:hypothetical protein